MSNSLGLNFLLNLFFLIFKRGSEICYRKIKFMSHDLFATVSILCVLFTVAFTDIRNYNQQFSKSELKHNGVFLFLCTLFG